MAVNKYSFMHAYFQSTWPLLTFSLFIAIYVFSTSNTLTEAAQLCESVDEV